MDAQENVTALLAEWQAGDSSALERLSPYIYDELHRIAASYMRRERSGGTLQTTAVVSEAYLRLADSEMNFTDRSHFFALAARMMRRILVDHARARQSAKRGSGAPHASFDEAAVVGADGTDLLELDDALDKLAAFDARMAKAIELRFFGGLTYEEAAEVLDISVTTLFEDIKLAKAWLKQQLT